MKAKSGDIWVPMGAPALISKLGIEFPRPEGGREKGQPTLWAETLVPLHLGMRRNVIGESRAL